MLCDIGSHPPGGKPLFPSVRNFQRQQHGGLTVLPSLLRFSPREKLSSAVVSLPRHVQPVVPATRKHDETERPHRRSPPHIANSRSFFTPVALATWLTCFTPTSKRKNVSAHGETLLNPFQSTRHLPPYVYVLQGKRGSDSEKAPAPFLSISSVHGKAAHQAISITARTVEPDTVPVRVTSPLEWAFSTTGPWAWHKQHEN